MIPPQELAARIAAVQPTVQEWRRSLHRRPELQYEEHETSLFVQAVLRAAGVEAVGGLARGTGVLGHLRGAAERAVALRADMDALPIEERSGVPWASEIPGRMHACGHDGHVAILLGAAKVLAEIARERPLPHPVTFLFQPAEEGGGGARFMIEDGALDGSRLGPPVDRIYGLHGWPALPRGAVATRPGPMLAAADRFTIEIHGAGGHAALPHQTRDPIVAAAELVLSLQSLVARETDPLDSAVVSVTSLHAGAAFNVVPESLRMQGTIRSLREATRARLHARLAERAHGVAAAAGCRAEVSIERGYPVTFNDPDLVEQFREAVHADFGASQVGTLPAPIMGAEDFSFYGERVPACFFALGLEEDPRQPLPPLHSPTFDFNDAAIPHGIAAMVRLALAG
jgi:amidohydrolase